ncbi:MAG TPA: hypothetical protein VEA18_03220 [Candidatus Kapabacteria bacterium]|nr:hypothetical protein [Candidatus Kapabacteria bacterium]
MGAYKKRKLKAGANPFILNVSELATIWHFPMSHVKTPLLQKAQGKKAEPPAGLPVERLVPGIPVEEPKATEQPTKRAYRTDSGDIAYLDDDQVRFG